MDYNILLKLYYENYFLEIFHCHKNNYYFQIIQYLVEYYLKNFKKIDYFNILL